MIQPTIFEAIEKGDAKQAIEIFNKVYGSANFNDPSCGYSPLHFAAWRGDSSLVRHFLMSGADVNILSVAPGSFTPLEFAYKFKPFTMRALLHPIRTNESFEEVAEILINGGAKMRKDMLGDWVCKSLYESLGAGETKTR